MITLPWKAGTILRFKGVKEAYLHMAFVFNATKIMELFERKEGSKSICRICLTDVNKPHPLTGEISILTGKLPTWKKEEEPSNNWSPELYVNRIEQAFKEFDGTEYHQIYNNCQHFVYRAVTGEKKSPDADKYQLIGWLAGLAGGESSRTSSEASEGLLKMYEEYRDDAVSAIQILKQGSQVMPSTQAVSIALDTGVVVLDSVQAIRKVIK